MNIVRRTDTKFLLFSHRVRVYQKCIQQNVRRVRRTRKKAPLEPRANVNFQEWHTAEHIPSYRKSK